MITAGERHNEYRAHVSDVIVVYVTSSLGAANKNCINQILVILAMKCILIYKLKFKISGKIGKLLFFAGYLADIKSLFLK